MTETTMVEQGVSNRPPNIMDVSDNFTPLLEKALFAPELPIERIIAIKEMVFEAREEEKKRQYFEAVTRAQGMMPKIMKTHHNGQTNSRYENLEDILDAIQPILEECGLAVMCGEAPDSPSGTIKIFYEVMHKAGFSKIFYYTCPLDNKGIKGNINKTDIMGQGSSVSYGRRYLHKMVWNLNTGDDNDGQSTRPVTVQKIYKPTVAKVQPEVCVVEYITPAQKLRLGELITAAQSSLESIYRACNVTCLDELTQGHYDRVVSKLLAKIEELEKTKENADVEMPE